MKLKTMIKGAVAWAAACTIALAGACGDVDDSAEKPRVGTAAQALGEGCTTDGDCSGDYHGEPNVCRNGNCVLGCDEASDCPFPEDVCDTTNGWCVSTFGDPANCGSLGNKCESYEACVSRSCEPIPVAEGLACEHSNQCNTGSYFGICVEGTCRNLETDEEHCGAYGIECDPGQVCEHGSCALTEGQPCDPANDPSDYDADSEGVNETFCYTGRAEWWHSQNDSNNTFFGDNYFNDDSEGPSSDTRLECCNVGGSFECVNILDDENCGECGGDDCTGEGPNHECVINRNALSVDPFCGCEWVDRHAYAETLSIEDSIQVAVCDTNLADTCRDNLFLGDDVSIGCGCGAGPASPPIAGISCSSGSVVGCSRNDECPYGQICNTSGMTGVCEVVGCDENSDCTSTGNSSGVAFSADSMKPWANTAGTISAGMRCTSNPPGSGDLNIDSVATPPSGYDGICVDISSDPAYCGTQTSPKPWISVGDAGTAVNGLLGTCGVSPAGGAVRELISGAGNATYPQRNVPRTVDNY